LHALLALGRLVGGALRDRVRDVLVVLLLGIAGLGVLVLPLDRHLALAVGEPGLDLRPALLGGDRGQGDRRYRTGRRPGGRRLRGGDRWSRTARYLGPQRLRRYVRVDLVLAHRLRRVLLAGFVQLGVLVDELAALLLGQLRIGVVLQRSLRRHAHRRVERRILGGHATERLLQLAHGRAGDRAEERAD